PQITVQAAASTATAISPASAGMGRPQRDVRRPHYPVESVTRGALDGRPAATGAAPTAVNDETALHQERLPFTVKVAGDRESLSAAISLRQAAYGRHVPELARNLNAPEPHDLAAGAVVLLAESKFDRQPLATMRIQTNQYEPLWLEQSVTLPGWLQGRNLAEATRLGTA